MELKLIVIKCKHCGKDHELEVEPQLLRGRVSYVLCPVKQKIISEVK